ncbi:hypothetical protein D3C73_915930 [compost metagenome]
MTGEKEPAAFPIGEQLQQSILKRQRPLQMNGLACSFVQLGQPPEQEGIIIQIGGNRRIAIPVTGQQPAIPTAAQLVPDEVCRSGCGPSVLGLLQRFGSLRQRRDHQPVPGRQHLIILRRMNALLPVVEQLLAPFLYPGPQTQRIHPHPFRHVIRQSLKQVRDIGTLEIPFRSNSVHMTVGMHILQAKRFFDLLTGEDVELPFHPFGIGILRRVESPLRRSHITLHIRKDLLRDLRIERFPRDLVRFQISNSQQCVIVEHFLKMRHQPLPVRGITREPVAHMVVHAALVHRLQRLLYHTQRFRLVIHLAVRQQKRQIMRRRKLRRIPEPAVFLIELAAVQRIRFMQQLLSGNSCPAFSGTSGILTVQRLKIRQQFVPELVQRFAVLLPFAVNLLQHIHQPNPPEHLPLGEIRPRIKRLLLRRQQHR